MKFKQVLGRHAQIRRQGAVPLPSRLQQRFSVHFAQGAIAYNSQAKLVLLPFVSIFRFGAAGYLSRREDIKSILRRVFYTCSAQNWDHMDPSLPKLLTMP